MLFIASPLEREHLERRIALLSELAQGAVSKHARLHTHTRQYYISVWDYRGILSLRKQTAREFSHLSLFALEGRCWRTDVQDAGLAMSSVTWTRPGVQLITSPGKGTPRKVHCSLIWISSRGGLKTYSTTHMTILQMCCRLTRTQPTYRTIYIIYIYIYIYIYILDTSFQGGYTPRTPPLSRPGGLPDSRIHSIRYNKYSLCIFGTFHHIQQL